MFHVKLASVQTSKLIELLGIDSETVGRIERFASLVLDANLRINLVSRGGDQVREVERQIHLSLAALPFVPDHEPLEWLDIGSGGGFPAIPIALCRPQIRFVLAESIAKKAFFLERVREALQSENVAVANVRVGEGTQGWQGCFDYLSIKAVAEWDQTLKWGNRFLKQGGRILTYKPAVPSTTVHDSFHGSGFELIHNKEVADERAQTRINVLILQKSSSVKPL